MSPRHARTATEDSDRVRPLDEIPFDPQQIADVRRPGDLDAVGRELADAHGEGRLSRAEADTLLLLAIPGTGILEHELRMRGATHLREEISAFVERRLREKLEQHRGVVVDIDRFTTASAASWTRRMIQRLVWDVLRQYRAADGALYRVTSLDAAATDDWRAHNGLERQLTAVRGDSSDEPELERQRRQLALVEQTLYTDKGSRRRMSDSARVHLAANFLYASGQWPRAIAPLTWQEREEVRQMLREENEKLEAIDNAHDPVIASRSLTEHDSRIPVALSSMWDGYDPRTRELLAASPWVAHALALAASTPFPRPRSPRTFAKFRRRALQLSDDARWRSEAAQVADAFATVFVDTQSSRSTPDVSAERESSASEGRQRWDALMLTHRMPAGVAAVATTGSDLVELLSALWLDTSYQEES